MSQTERYIGLATVEDNPYDRGYWDVVLNLGDFREMEADSDMDNYVLGRNAALYEGNYESHQ